jgi:hypothetical protein
MIKYMCAGEDDKDLRKLTVMGIPQLCMLYEHASMILYDNLESRVFQILRSRIRAGYYDAGAVKAINDEVPALATEINEDMARKLTGTVKTSEYAVAKTVVRPRKIQLCYKCSSLEHKVRDCKTAQSTPVPLYRCYSCNEKGHMARNCPYKVKAAIEVQPQVSKKSSVTTCDREVKRGEVTRTGAVI